MSRSAPPRCQSCGKRRPVSYSLDAYLCDSCTRLWQDAAAPPEQPVPLADRLDALRRHYNDRRTP